MKQKKPTEVKTEPVSKTPAEKKTAPTIKSPASANSKGGHGPNPGDVVVPFEKINEIIKKTSHGNRSPKTNKIDKGPPSEKQAQSGTQKTKTEDIQQKGEKPTSKARKPRNQKPTTEKKNRRKEETPSLEPEQPKDSKETPRKGESEQIIYLKLSELHVFKNHPFGIRDDEEMRAMVESVKDKGITQPAIVRPRKGSGYEIVSGHRVRKPVS